MVTNVMTPDPPTLIVNLTQGKFFAYYYIHFVNNKQNNTTLFWVLQLETIQKTTEDDADMEFLENSTESRAEQEDESGFQELNTRFAWNSEILHFKSDDFSTLALSKGGKKSTDNIRQKRGAAGSRTTLNYSSALSTTITTTSATPENANVNANTNAIASSTTHERVHNASVGETSAAVDAAVRAAVSTADA